MPGLYDRLTSQLGDDDDKPTGLTPLDLMNLPEDQRRVMFVFLRDTQAASKGITQEALQAKLEDMETLADTLDELIRNTWLIASGEPARYKLNMARKRGGSKSGGNLWSALGDRLSGSGENADESDNSEPPHMTPPSMSDW